MKAYKGFNKDMTCKDFQYEVGKEYETDKAKACEYGFHACEHPLDCFSYYAPNESIYCEVEQTGDISKANNDTKVASTKIKIGAEIGIKELIKAAFEYAKERCTNEQMGGYKSALQGGYKSALQGGDWSALQGGDWSVVYGGEGAKVSGGLHSVLAIQYWKDGVFQCIKFKEVDGRKIKANTFYKLDKAGRFVEVKE